MISNSTKGQAGEEKVKKHYQENGYAFVTQNYNFYKKKGRGRVGEIDLVFCKNQQLIIVEVKTRSTNKFGSPLEQVDSKKMFLIQKTYNHFILKYPKFQNYFARFDFAAVTSNGIQIIENAYIFN